MKFIIILFISLFSAFPTQDDPDPAGMDSRPASQPAPRPADGRLQVALKAYEIGDFARAERELRAGLELEPERADLHARIGIVLYRLQRWGDAAASIEKSLQLNKAAAGSVQILGHCYYELGKLDEALVCYNKAIETNNNSRDAWRGKGLTLEKLGRYDEAEESLRKAIVLNPTSASAHLWLARVLTKKKQPGSAIPYLEQARRIDPFDWEIEFELSRVYAALGEATKIKPAKDRSDFLRGHREVINKLKKQLLSAPNDVSIIIQLGTQYDAIGDSVHSGGAWEKARRVTRDDASVMIAQALSLYTIGDRKAAEELLRQDIKKRPNEPALWEVLWFVLKERGDKKGSDDAAARFKQVTNRDPQPPALPTIPSEGEADSRPAPAK